ncbi:helix-turn-helix transcriptional regulator [Kutzneria sp. CA-103260]|uniref:helix-turn-helix transcriptional regulator n=1 Tax=Kutzneria sp. CA-103260 TaxID=2802641 RepID=UPI001BA55B67|nr:helix-turn-helix transcriptional regulator [Kutzneria sp. CA-103260]
MSDQLGEFLRARRSALTPAGVGVPTYGETRRVPGLRREEVAQLAGISVKYYTRLEQGEGGHVSESVLESLGNALQLNAHERAHLLRLARPEHTRLVRRPTGVEEVRPTLLALVDSAADQAAVIIGRYFDLIGGNRLGYALFGVDPGARVNMLKQTFLDPSARDLLVDWESNAIESAAYLRLATGDLPGDPIMAELIGELTIQSPEFARIWATQPVNECGHGVRRFNHPMVGPLTLNEESLRLPSDPGQRILFFGADPGSDSADRLRLLDSLINTRVPLSDN